MGFVFILWPVLEVYAIYRFCLTYGFGSYLLYSLATGALGIAVMSIQGRSAVIGLQRNLAAGKSPTRQILHRALILLGGFLIFLPGVMTDVVGALLILPGSRHLFLILVRELLTRGLLKNSFRVVSFQSDSAQFERDATVIDADVLETSSRRIE